MIHSSIILIIFHRKDVAVSNKSWPPYSQCFYLKQPTPTSPRPFSTSLRWPPTAVRRRSGYDHQPLPHEPRINWQMYSGDGNGALGLVTAEPYKKGPRRYCRGFFYLVSPSAGLICPALWDQFAIDFICFCFKNKWSVSPWSSDGAERDPMRGSFYWNPLNFQRLSGFFFCPCGVYSTFLLILWRRFTITWVKQHEL